ncbi:MAG: thioredoxin family protein [Bacteroidetes bacterium]|nr:thioredoxin family protein [Bacteroidota bacterium]
MKRILTCVLFAAVFGFVLAGLFFRDSLTNYVSKSIIPKTEAGSFNPDSLFVDSAYNYIKNRMGYQLTWLEFGSTHCRECKLMEVVMKEVKADYPGSVNAIFYNVSLKENKSIVQHYGIVMIQVQVLLDKNGKECFRHTGFLSYEDLTKEFKNYGISKTN